MTMHLAISDISLAKRDVPLALFHFLTLCLSVQYFVLIFLVNIFFEDGSVIMKAKKIIKKKPGYFIFFCLQWVKAERWVLAWKLPTRIFNQMEWGYFC